MFRCYYCNYCQLDSPEIIRDFITVSVIKFTPSLTTKTLITNETVCTECEEIHKEVMGEFNIGEEED